MTQEEQEKAIIELQATVKTQGETIASQAKTIDGHVDAIIKLEGTVTAHEKTITDLTTKVNSTSATPGPAVKKEKFKGIKAVNKDSTGKPENEYHFAVAGKNYRFVNDNVSLPPDTSLGNVGTRITALAAQSSTSLQALLVKTGSSQIKEVA